jgi:hypothetical protein
LRRARHVVEDRAARVGRPVLVHARRAHELRDDRAAPAHDHRHIGKDAEPLVHAARDVVVQGLLFGDLDDVRELRVIERGVGRAKERRGRVVRFFDHALAIHHAVRERSVRVQIREARARDLRAIAALRHQTQLLASRRVLGLERFEPSHAVRRGIGLGSGECVDQLPARHSFVHGARYFRGHVPA